VAGTPVDIRRAALHSMRRLLPRMPLAGYAAAVLHPLLRCLDGGPDELRRDAADTICALALALGPDFALFVPTIRKARARPALHARAPLCACAWTALHALSCLPVVRPRSRMAGKLTTYRQPPWRRRRSAGPPRTARGAAGAEAGRPRGAQIMARHRTAHERFSLLAAKVTLREPPCMSDAEDWEAGHGWVDDLAPPPEPAAALPPMPDPSGARARGACKPHSVKAEGIGA